MRKSGVVSILSGFKKNLERLPCIREGQMIYWHWRHKGFYFVPDHRRDKFGIKGDFETDVHPII